MGHPMGHSGGQWGPIGANGAPYGSAPHVAPPRPVSGYARVLLAAMSVLLMPSSPLPAALCYGLSAAMDAVDGMAARWLDQGERDFRDGGNFRDGTGFRESGLPGGGRGFRGGFGDFRNGWGCRGDFRGRGFRGFGEGRGRGIGGGVRDFRNGWGFGGDFRGRGFWGG